MKAGRLTTALGIVGVVFIVCGAYVASGRLGGLYMLLGGILLGLAIRDLLRR